MELPGVAGGAARPAACGTCLSSERALAPLSSQHELHRLYTALLSTLRSQIFKKEQPSDIYICWECRAVLRKTLQFLKRAACAQDWLEWASTQQDIDVNSNSLSTLQYLHKTNYDVMIIENLSSMKKEIQSDEDVPTDAPDYASDNNDSKPIIEFAEPETIVMELAAIKNEKYKSRIKTEIKPYEKIGRISKKSLSKSKMNKLPYKMIKISEQQVSQLREEARKKPKYLNAPFRCESCIMPFLFRTAYETHLKLRHCDKPSYHTCNICKGTFKTARVLKLHKHSHYQHYRCNECDQTSLSGTAMYQHYIVKHLSRPATANRYKCLECGVRFDRQKLLTLHKVALHQHYECDKCGRKFATRKSIEKHLPSHQTQCKLCGLVLASRANLRNHKFLVHQSHDVSKSDAYCVECDKTFKHRIAYKEHVKGVHRSIKTKYSCTQCEKIFTRKIYLRNHIEHVHLNASRFQCHLCSKTFPRRDGMRRHIESVHEGITLPRTKMCEICGRGFQTKKILDNHRRTHTGERPYQCEYCSAAFTQVTPLKTHLKRIHQQERSGRELSVRVHNARTEPNTKVWILPPERKIGYTPKYTPCSETETGELPSSN